MKNMKNGKAVGPDDILIEAWKCLGEVAVEFQTKLFNRFLEGELTPDERSKKCACADSYIQE